MMSGPTKYPATKHRGRSRARKAAIRRVAFAVLCGLVVAAALFAIYQRDFW
jgi:hypothetical protein